MNFNGWGKFSAIIKTQNYFKMEQLIKYLEDQIKRCDTFGFPKEKRAYLGCLREAKTQALNLPCVINWVAIDRELPKEHEDVLVYYYHNKASRHFPNNQFIKETSFYDGEFECKEEVTHWAALPEPPCS